MADAIPIRPNMATELHVECTALIARGVHPVAAVAYARNLQCMPLLVAAFPKMPQHKRNCLITGTASLVHNQFDDWEIVHRDEPTA